MKNLRLIDLFYTQDVGVRIPHRPLSYNRANRLWVVGDRGERLRMTEALCMKDGAGSGIAHSSSQ